MVEAASSCLVTQASLSGQHFGTCPLFFKQLVRLGDLCERIGMRDQRFGIEFALGNELQRFLSITTASAAGLEDLIFSIHTAHGVRSFSSYFFVYSNKI